MDYKEKIIRERELIKHWDEVKKHKERLIDLLLNKRKLNMLDYPILFQCISIVLENIEVYEEEITSSKDTKTESMRGSLQGIFDEMLKDIKIPEKEEAFLLAIESLVVSLDKKSSINDRFKAIQRIKKIGWQGMYKGKKEIAEIVENYPNGMDEKKIFTIYQCISIVLLELDAQEQEKRLLEDLYN